MRKRLILIVDDEPPIARLSRAKLEADGYAVVLATNGEEALRRIEEDRPDLVVLDVMMPVMDGFEVLRRLRATSQLPVILLTARTSDIDKLTGLHGGADDYLTKPFNPDELSARIAAIMRRSAGVGIVTNHQLMTYPATGVLPEVTIDIEQRRIMVGGAEVRLSRTEWELLTQLAANSGRVMLHGELLSRIWGPEFRDEVQYLRTWISRIRTKLEPSASDGSRIITTFPGLGYRMESPVAMPPAE
ncbi:MAG TPA: response regulator transcription factor [Thermomicrobiales bacterium]|nr:response regulator transcription factor [Thermomicrobiales bacterium]